MLSDIAKAFGIVLTLVRIVSFFAFVAPTNRANNSIEASSLEVKQTSAVLENLIMVHKDSVSSFASSYGECATD